MSRSNHKLSPFFSNLNFRLAWLLFLLLSFQLSGLILPAGTTIEARFSTATGSRISHPGDEVKATIISPVSLRGEVLIPQGAKVLGIVESAVPLGFGLKHRTAAISYRFSDLRLESGVTLPVNAQLVEIETEKERVDSRGVVLGVRPIANLSSTSDFCTIPFLFVNPLV